MKDILRELYKTRDEQRYESGIRDRYFLSSDDLQDAIDEIERLRKEAKGPKIDPKSWWYRNCKNQRRREAKICGSCPFRAYIEFFEKSNLIVSIKEQAEGPKELPRIGAGLWEEEYGR